MWNNKTDLNNDYSKEDTTMFVDGCVIDTKEYYGEFWNKIMKGRNSDYEKLKVGKAGNGIFVLPYDSNRRYLVALTEENVFLNGDGADKPVGVLHDTEGAETGVITAEITFNDVISLYMSVKSKYRKKGVWVMNDETALALRKLKDADGNYIWNHNTDTILGKPVYISEYMPGVVSGGKPIVFGDFSYYWIINRRPLAVRTLTEKFALKDQTGYLAVEYLDGRLIRREAIKTMQIS